MSRTLPNIVYLHCHDMGRYNSAYGHDMPTPHIRRFTEQGVLFRNAFTVNPTCSPSRAALLTSQWPHENGMMGLAHRGWKLKDYTQAVPHALRDAGYHTALTGVQHVAMGEGITPENTGYETVDVRSWKGGGDNENAAGAVEFIKQDHDRPFFLDIGFFCPHRGGPDPTSFPFEDPLQNPNHLQVPAHLPDTPETRRDMAEYIASVQLTDRNMGRVLEALDEAGLRDNTIVILTTDHGIAFPGMKCCLTDHGIGVTLALRAPGLPIGKCIDAMATHMDVFPTVFELAGLSAPDHWRGQSLMPVINGVSERVHEAIFTEVTYHASYEPMRSVRTERYKLIQRLGERRKRILPNCDDSPSKTVMCDRGWGDEVFADAELYDLHFDSQERHNVVNDSAYREAYAQLNAQLMDWMTRTHDPLLQGDIPLPPEGVINDPDSYSPGGEVITAEQWAKQMDGSAGV